MSDGVAKRIADTYTPWATELGMPLARLPMHPSEDAIVKEASTHHASRLRAELAEARPEQIVTLGNAALWVLRVLLAAIAGLPSQLAADGSYGQIYEVELPSGQHARWLPLAHPAAPQPYQTAHHAWIAGLSASIA